MFSFPLFHNIEYLKNLKRKKGSRSVSAEERPRCRVYAPNRSRFNTIVITASCKLALCVRGVGSFQENSCR